MMHQLKTQNAKRKTIIQNAKFYILSFGFTLFAFSFTLICYAQSISSTELINNAKFYDGKIVVYAGEVIGDVMVRGEYAWININDGENALGIWVNKNLVKDILYTGSYKSRGDWVEVAGFFQRACPQHGGDLDIHAQALRKINPGRAISERFNSGKKNQVLILLGVLCLVWILQQLKYKQKRK